MAAKRIKPKSKTTKSKLIENGPPVNTLSEQCLPKKIRYRLDVTYTAVDQVLKDRGWQRVEGDSWDFYWCDLNFVPVVLNKFLGPKQIVPHFINYYEIARKNHLARNLTRYKRALLKEGNEAEANLCNCIPTTFELPNDYILFLNYYKKNVGKFYIVKPAAGCKGQGIFLFKKIKKFDEWRATRDKNQSAMNSNDQLSPFGEKEKDYYNTVDWVIQIYIQNPYLLGGRKFDIRFFVLVVSFQPMIVWVARDGFARFCGKNFNLQNIKDNFCHLTNTSIQLAPDVENPGYKWPLQRVRQYLTAKHGLEVFETLLQDIALVILTSLKACRKIIVHSKHSFELYGYDVLIDDQLKPWLLEVNASPSLDATDDGDFLMKCRLLSDMFNIIDYEEQRSGDEIRVGGFDLLWNNGPIYRISPANSELGPIMINKNLNINLGAYNNSEEQFKEVQLWKDIVKYKSNIKVNENNPRSKQITLSAPTKSLLMLS